MKKLVLSIICSCIITFTPTVFASSLSVNPDPSYLTQRINVVCIDNTNAFSIYATDQVTVLGLEACSDGLTFTSPISVVGTNYYISEYNPISYTGSPSSDTLSTMRSNVGYVSDVSFSVLSLPSGSCPADQVCYMDWLIVNLFILFFLSLMSLGLFINFFKRKH